MKMPSLSFKRDCRLQSGAAHGQSLVEFAVSLPILLLLIVGTVDLGRLYFAYMSVTNAARQGARWGAAYPSDCIGIQNKAKDEVDNVIIKKDDPTHPLVVTATCPGLGYRDNMVVTVQYPFQLITTAVLGGGTLQLQAKEEMLVFVNTQ